MKQIVYNIFLLLLLASCSNTVDQVKRIDKAPDLSTMNVYLPEADKTDTKWNKEYQVNSTNSLWCSNSSQFFKDNRSLNVGDLIRVIISVADSADFENNTELKRNSNHTIDQHLTWLRLFRVAIGVTKPGSTAPAPRVTKSNYKHSGDASVSRAEEISTEIAATVIKILPNGNLLIRGHQEILVGHELRQIQVSGIIRAKDITSSNSINGNQIAEARIVYGGKGDLSDIQQPALGYKIINIFSPF